MRKLELLFLIASVAVAASSKPPAVEAITVGQLTASLDADQGKADADIAQQLTGLHLSERLTAARFARLSATLPGEKSRQALVILADSSAFLSLPESEIVPDPTPDAATLRKMMVAIVNYANTTLHQMPNFVAERDTAAYEDRPAEDVQEATDVVSLSYLPPHPVGRSTATVTYRDGHEVVTDAKDLKAAQDSPQKPDKHAPKVQGLLTAGEFGSFLRTILADAVKGKITWSHWEQGVSETDAVFHLSVPAKQSNYVVRFCCVAENGIDAFSTHIFSEQAAYHGEIVFNPETGAVLRITADAEMPTGELVASADMVVEYAPVQIGDKTAILLVKSVSLLQAHTVQPHSGMHMAIYTGTPKTFLNDTVFSNYRQFRGEARILTGENAGP